jgi:branched-chain amino acid transport system ATP-binding protein
MTSVSTLAPVTTALVVTGVSRSFRSITALLDVDLTLRRGEVLGLIGPNGAGKSTLVNIISGYDRPDAGTVTVDGSDVTRTGARARCRGGIARTFQHGNLFGGLTVRENVEVVALATGAGRSAARSIADETMALLDVRRWADHEARALPHGVERRVGVARALATRPQYLLLDEPAAGLNEGEIASFGDSVRTIAGRGTGVLLIDHNVRLILAICDRIKVVVEGRNFLEGTADEVRNSPELAEAYLGKSGTRDAARGKDRG